MKDHRKLCNQTHRRYYVSRVSAAQFTVTMTLAMNGNENAWEYPVFSMLPGCTAMWSSTFAHVPSYKIKLHLSRNKAMIKTVDSNFSQSSLYVARVQWVRQSHVKSCCCYRTSTNCMNLPHRRWNVITSNNSCILRLYHLQRLLIFIRTCENTFSLILSRGEFVERNVERARALVISSWAKLNCKFTENVLYISLKKKKKLRSTLHLKVK